MIGKIISFRDRLLKCQRGAVEMTALVLLSWIVIMLMTAGVDIFLMSSKFINVSNAAQQALDGIKDEGMLTPEIQALFNGELERRNITNVELVSASTTQVLRGEPVHFHVRTNYKINSFRPLGLSDEALTMHWDIVRTGISRRFIRYMPEI